MSDHDVLHSGYLVPIRRDSRDGTVLVICYLDSEWGIGPADGWALYCPACRVTVSATVPGSEGLPEIDGLPDDLADAFFRTEMRLSSEHAAAMAAQPEPVTFRTTVGGRNWRPSLRVETHR